MAALDIAGIGKKIRKAVTANWGNKFTLEILNALAALKTYIDSTNGLPAKSQAGHTVLTAGSGGSVTFPVSLVSDCYILSLTLIATGPDSPQFTGGGAHSIMVTEKTKTGFSYIVEPAFNAGYQSHFAIDWIAIPLNTAEYDPCPVGGILL